MKQFKLLILLITPIFSYGQYKSSYLREIFFGRLPSARAEAMGKSYTSIDGDLTSVYFNPAGISTITGLEIIGSYTPPPYYLGTDSYYRFFAAGYKINRYLQVSVSQFHFNYGKIPIQAIKTTPYTEKNTLTIASEPLHNLNIGLNTNYLISQFGTGEPGSSMFFDFGIIKKIKFLQSETTNHSINIGASISNFNFAKVTYESHYKEVLPVTSRFGINYQFHLNKNIIIDTLETFQFLVQGEYQNVLNSDYETAYRTGVELMLLEMLSIRAGYYMETLYDYGYPSINFDRINDFTYGFGLQIPLHKVTKIPLKINFDYTSLPQPPYSTNSNQFGNFTTYNLRLNWIFKKSK